MANEKVDCLILHVLELVSLPLLIIENCDISLNISTRRMNVLVLGAYVYAHIAGGFTGLSGVCNNAYAYALVKTRPEQS